MDYQQRISKAQPTELQMLKIRNLNICVTKNIFCSLQTFSNWACQWELKEIFKRWAGM